MVSKAGQEEQERMPAFGKHSQTLHFTVICKSYSRIYGFDKLIIKIPD